MPLIDEQHKRLLDLINELFKACRRGRDEADQYFRKTIKDAVDYVKVHFATEEKYMLQYGYPEYRAHKSQHESFVKAIIEYVNRFEAGEPLLPNKFVRYLKEWLLEHIAVSDKKYASLFQQASSG